MSGEVHVRFCERLEVKLLRATHLQVYVKSKAAGERVMASLERFLKKRLRLKVNREKSAVGRPWKRKFLGYRTTMDRKPRLRPAPQSVKRLKLKLKGLFATTTGCRQ